HPFLNEPLNALHDFVPIARQAFGQLIERWKTVLFQLPKGQQLDDQHHFVILNTQVTVMLQQTTGKHDGGAFPGAHVKVVIGWTLIHGDASRSIEPVYPCTNRAMRSMPFSICSKLVAY